MGGMSVVVFVVAGCPHCDALLEDLRRRRVAHSVVDLRRRPERIAEVVRLTWDRRVPVLVDHERVTVGFNGRSSAIGERGGGPL